MREDWIEVALGQICIKAEKVKRNDMPADRELKYLDIGGIDNKTNRIVEHKDYKWSSAPSRAQQIIRVDDILFSTVRTYLKNIAQVVNPIYEDQIASSGFTVIRGRADAVSPKFLFYYSLSIQFLNPLSKLQTGSSYPAVRDKDVFAQSIPLPPLPEQRAIVAKLEQLFSDLDSGIADLKRAQAKLKIYRQAVLKKAFEGELTKEWREQQNDLPTAEELLEQIKEERNRHYEQQLSEWKAALKEWEKSGKDGKKPGKPVRFNDLERIAEDELATLNSLPKTWSWQLIDSLVRPSKHSLKAGPFGSSLKKSIYVSEGYKIYGQEQVIGGDWSIGDYYISRETYDSLSSCMVQANDVLISLVGTVGKVLILPPEAPAGIINPRLVKVSLDGQYLPMFFKYYFESAYLKSLYKNKNHGTTMDVLNLGIIEELPFPFCSINEQVQIVQEIESRLSVCDRMEETITINLQKAEALRQSILKMAFEGRLLSKAELDACRKEKDWCPAAELLERLKSKDIKKSATEREKASL